MAGSNRSGIITREASSGGGGSAPAPPIVYPKLIISEVQISPNEERFIEIYNPNAQDVVLTDWYIQRKTETGDSFTSLVTSTNFEGKIILANSHFLISENSQEADIVLAMFAYHHISDDDKNTFLKQVRGALKPQGLLILGEIYTPNRKTTISYYENLYNSIPKEKQSPALKKFLTETAESEQFEFKVTKSFADNQLTKNNFTLLQSEKIFPTDNTFNPTVGTFVEVWKT